MLIILYVCVSQKHQCIHQNKHSSITVVSWISQDSYIPVFHVSHLVK